MMLSIMCKNAACENDAFNTKHTLNTKSTQNSSKYNTQQKRTIMTGVETQLVMQALNAYENKALNGYENKAFKRL